jgi:hypothetical protein
VQFDHAPSLEPALDLPRAHSGFDQLPPRDDPVLAARKPLDHPLSTMSGELATHTVVNPALDRLAPFIALKRLD